MIEIAAALSMANAAFNTIKGAVEKGREIEDVQDTLDVFLMPEMR